uniref:Conserved hypothetical phage tail region protein n=1 Tax=Candidatus Kentrum sp. LPFa TaxID=2126335 RepID=A0A450VVM9_9GAMM|nr:MAG: conserved hypothetical phage tail region protein [Candidatus Kentron sp. LPFa]
MATTKEEMKTAYPLPVYNYKVEIGGENVAFSEVSGLNITYETIVHRESPTEGVQAGPKILCMPAQGTPANLTLKKGVVRGKSVSTLYNWISSIRLNQIDKKDVIIRLCDEEGSAVVSWKVINAFPTVLEAPTFDASENEVAVESMELMADDVKIEES